MLLGWEWYAAAQQQQQRAYGGMAGAADAPDGGCTCVGRGQLLARYRRVSRLGDGAFAALWRGVDTETGCSVAIKEETRLPGHRGGRCGAGEQELSEAGILRQLRHPAVVRLLAWAPPPRPGDGEILVLELAAGGDLFDALEEGTVAPDECPSIMLQVTSALAHVHRAGFVHCDVKLENILLDATMRHALLCDFGLAGRAGQVRRGRPAGTKQYMAPELVEPRHDDADYALDPAADVWSLGVVLFALLFGQMPWVSAVPGEDPLYDAFALAGDDAACDAPWSLMCAGGFRECVLSMLDARPERRPSLADTLRSGALLGPWVEPQSPDSGNASPEPGAMGGDPPAFA